MILFSILACEIGFWVLLGAGLTARYLLRARTLSTILLICVPLIDAVLLALSAIDLLGGNSPATASHGLAAIYIGVSIAFGKQMVNWADQRFAHCFADGAAPTRPPRTGPAHAAYLRHQWLRHLGAYSIGAGLLGLLTLLVSGSTDPAPMWGPFRLWTTVLIIDFLISFSHTLLPRKNPSSRPVEETQP